MLPKRVSVKFFAQNPENIQVGTFIPVFQRWIQQQTVPGLLIDVADYQHVPDGPGVVLIAHEGDYALDFKDGRPGLSYVSKRPIADNLSGLMGHVFGAALTAVKQLEQEETLAGLQIGPGRAEVVFVDRLATPNLPDTLAALEADLSAFFEPLYGEGFTVSRVDNDRRACLTLAVASQETVSAATLLARLEAVGAVI